MAKDTSTDGNAKQDVAEKLRDSSSVLITVSNNPTVDQLASAIGLTLMLDKLGKHTTAVFSGQVPNTMEFLQPDHTFDATVDGLRDFIVSLDKDKADKLRYKVEDNVVKIFITPYKSKITEADLEFSQGDFNVDLVVALGVHKRNDLDNAIISHGRILHDATIVTINSTNGTEGNMGAIDWTDTKASSLAEMLVSISEALEGGILDEQMSTAFLTGIVAATDRFKNDNTTPKVMTMAAQLMAAGANQQLIATNLQLKPPEPEQLQEPEPPKPEEPPKPKQPETVFAQEDEFLSIDRSDKLDTSQGSDTTDEAPADSPAPPRKAVGDDLDDDDLLADIESAVQARHKKLDADGRTQKLDQEDPAIQKLEDDLSHDSSSNLIDLESKLKSFDPNRVDQSADRKPIGDVKPSSTPAAGPGDQPSMGGTFNATARQAREDKDVDRRDNANQELLSHNQSPDAQSSAQAADMPSSEDLMRDLENARRAVEDAMNEAEFNPAGQPIQSLNATPIPADNGSGADFSIPGGPPPQQQQTGLPPLQQYQQPGQTGPPMQPPPQQDTNVFGMPGSTMQPDGQQLPPPPLANGPQSYGPPPAPPNGNPMFNIPPQQAQPTAPNGNGNGYPPMDNGQNGSVPPPPSAPPPPMPPGPPPAFN